MSFHLCSIVVPCRFLNRSLASLSVVRVSNKLKDDYDYSTHLTSHPFDKPRQTARSALTLTFCAGACARISILSSPKKTAQNAADVQTTSLSFLLVTGSESFFGGCVLPLVLAVAFAATVTVANTIPIPIPITLIITNFRTVPCSALRAIERCVAAYDRGRVSTGGGLLVGVGVFESLLCLVDFLLGFLLLFGCSVGVFLGLLG